MKTYLQKILLLVFLYTSSSAFGQILINETFNGSSTPSGWSNSIISGGVSWSFTNVPVFTTTSGGNYAKFLDTQASTINNAYLMTPVLNCTGRTSVKVKFEHYWDDVELIHCYVEVSPDNGATWVQAYSDVDDGSGDIGTYAVPMVTTLDITAIVANMPSARVRFRFVNEGSTAGKSWNIDNVLIYTDPGLDMYQFVTPDYLGCATNYTNAELVTVKVINRGINNISNFPVSVDIITGLANGISQTITTTYVPILMPGDTNIYRKRFRLYI